jgi:tRNA(Ile)-lysidine synthase
MLERVAGTIERHAMFAPGQRVGVAVSGGADSTALLYVLLDLRARWDLRLSVLHVNHCLRGEESESDARFVRELARRLGLEFRCHEADVPRIISAEGGNLEQTARRVRRDFFLGLIRAGELDRVALGHTCSDQAETVLFRILRGAGIKGLAGIRPVTAEGLVRPLIDVTRTDVLGYLRAKGISWREDSSNQDRRFARNRIRHDLLPALEREWNPALTEVLAGMAEVAQGEENYWRQFISATAEGHLIARPPEVIFRAGWLAGLHPAVARRMIRTAIEQARGDLRRIDMSHVARVLSLARTAGGSRRFEIPGLEVWRSFEWIRLAPPGHGCCDYDIEVSVPGRVRPPGGGFEVELELLPPGGDSGYNKEVSEQLDWGRIAGVLRLRNWRPGDQYRPLGRANRIKVNSLLQHAHVPLWERRGWPILTQGGAIVWVAQFGPAAELAATTQSLATLKVREIHDISRIV